MNDVRERPIPALRYWLTFVRLPGLQVDLILRNLVFFLGLKQAKICTRILRRCHDTAPGLNYFDGKLTPSS
jgi:hypothetical protein